MDTTPHPLLLKRFKDFLAPCQVGKSGKCRNFQITVKVMKGITLADDAFEAFGHG